MSRCRALPGDVIRQAGHGEGRAAALRPAVNDRLFARSARFHGTGGANRVDDVAGLRRRDGVLMPAAAAEPLIVGTDDDVAFFDESLDARQPVIRPGVAVQKKILVEPLRRVEDLGRPAILRRPRRAVRPRHDGAAVRRRRSDGGDDQCGDDGLVPRDVGGDVRDAPGLRPDDRGRYQLLGNNLSQHAVRTHRAGSRVKGRSWWLSVRKPAARSDRTPESHRNNEDLSHGRIPRCGFRRRRLTRPRRSCRSCAAARAPLSRVSVRRTESPGFPCSLRA